MLTIAHINPNRLKAPRKLTERQQLHLDALATVAHARAMDKIRAEKMFAPEMAEIAELEKQYEALCQR